MLDRRDTFTRPYGTALRAALTPACTAGDPATAEQSAASFGARTKGIIQVRTTTIHRTCLTCATEAQLRVPVRAWHNWTIEGLPARRAFRELPAELCRWLTEMTCPDCYIAVITTTPADYHWEGTCAGCGLWESIAVSPIALDAFRTGKLTDTEAFPNLTDEQRCLIDLSTHVDCCNDAVYGRPPGEPSPFPTTR